MQVVAPGVSARPDARAERASADTRTATRTPLHFGYLPGLDGLRAFAVMAVLLYHDDLSWMPGGFLGVEIFFVISGYLITSLLLAEWRNEGGIGLRHFYVRRARRLLPALFLLLATVSVFALLFLPDETARLRGDVIAALTYCTNWFLVFKHESYFEFAGRPSLLKHLWSLAVEEQFYVLWPLLFTGLLRLWGRDRRKLLVAILGGALASSILMAVMYRPLHDVSRIYYGTDTRASGLLIGAALSLVWAPWRLSKRVSSGGRVLLNVVGVAGLLTLAWFVLETSEFDNGLYRGGFAVLALVTAVVIAVSVHPAADIGRLLGWGPIRWIGLRSYGIYLWHWPIFQITRPHLDIDLTGYPLLALRLGLTFAAAELSYRFVEQPIRHGALGRHFSALRRADGAERLQLASRTLYVGGAAALVVALAAIGLANARPAPPLPGYQSQNAAVTSPATTATTAAAPVTQPGAPGAPPPAQPVFQPHISAVGDSVMLGAIAQLQAIPDTYVDAAVSRQFPAIIQIFRDLRDQGRLGDTAVVHTGTNGLISGGQFDELMSVLKNERRVIVFNVKVPRRWEGPNNDTIAAAAQRYPNVRLVDWHAIGGAHPEWFYDDGIHLRPVGREAYANLVRQNL